MVGSVSTISEIFNMYYNIVEQAKLVSYSFFDQEVTLPKLSFYILLVIRPKPLKDKHLTGSSSN